MGLLIIIHSQLGSDSRRVEGAVAYQEVTVIYATVDANAATPSTLRPETTASAKKAQEIGFLGCVDVGLFYCFRNSAFYALRDEKSIPITAPRWIVKAWCFSVTVGTEVLLRSFYQVNQLVT